MALAWDGEDQKTWDIYAKLIGSGPPAHLAGLLDAKATITVEIEAEIPSGAPDNVVRSAVTSSLVNRNQTFRDEYVLVRSCSSRPLRILNRSGLGAEF